MSQRSVRVCAPTRREGREVWVDGRSLGSARSLRALTELLNAAGWEGMDEVDVAEWAVIEWYGGGPEVWSQQSDPWPVSAVGPGTG
ncbi:hypothetical protein [Streptomyces aureus]|uniref:hypothetical protein n=1 Tax=Streptomyces aureus TaxID=193461 RepID=UPI00367EFEEA